MIAAAEVAGKLIFDRGLASQMRPKKYYTIPRETLERSLEDVEQLINFFVIEFQRIVYAENIYATITVSLDLAQSMCGTNHSIGIRRCPDLLLPRQVCPKVGYRLDGCHCYLLRSSCVPPQPGAHR